MCFHPVVLRQVLYQRGCLLVPLVSCVTWFVVLSFRASQSARGPLLELVIEGDWAFLGCLLASPSRGPETHLS